MSSLASIISRSRSDAKFGLELRLVHVVVPAHGGDGLHQHILMAKLLYCNTPMGEHTVIVLSSDSLVPRLPLFLIQLAIHSELKHLKCTRLILCLSSILLYKEYRVLL